MSNGFVVYKLCGRFTVTILLKKIFQIISVELILFFFISSISYTQELNLVRNSKPQGSIVIQNNPSVTIRLAATELQNYLYRISEAKFSIDSENPSTGIGIIFVGNTNLAKQLKITNEVKRLKPNGFIVKTTLSGQVVIDGKDDLGTLYGVYELLEKFGVRWYMPGSLGEVVPHKENLRISNLNLREEPDFTYRWIGSNVWSRRNKMNVNITNSLPEDIPVDKYGIPLKPASDSSKPIGDEIWKSFHSFGALLNANKYFRNHPEYYPLINGKRRKLSPTKGLNNDNQICTTDPEVILQVASNMQDTLKKNPRIKIITLGPNDGRGFCEGPCCTSLDESKAGRDRKYTRRLLLFYDAVARIINKTDPDRIVKFGAYFLYTEPPIDSNIRVLNNMMVMLTDYEQFCLAHTKTDKNCPRNRKFNKILKGWKSIVNKTGIYEYYYKVNWYELPWPIVHTISKDIPYYQKNNVQLFYTQYSLNNVGTLILNYYVAAKLLWNSSLNVDSLMNDFYKRFYKKAATPMKHYYETLEAAVIKSGLHFPGDANKYATCVFTDSIMAELSNSVSEARKDAVDSLVKKRIKMVSVSFEYMKQCMHFLKLAAKANSIVEFHKAIKSGEDLVSFLARHRSTFKGIINLDVFFKRKRPVYVRKYILKLQDKMKKLEMEKEKK